MFANIEQFVGPDERLIQYAWPGGYPIYYLDGNNATLCPDCANAEYKRLEDDDKCKPRFGFVYLEGDDYFCAECNCRLESAYGVPDEN